MRISDWSSDVCSSALQLAFYLWCGACAGGYLAGSLRRVRPALRHPGNLQGRPELGIHVLAKLSWLGSGGVFDHLPDDMVRYREDPARLLSASGDRKSEASPVLWHQCAAYEDRKSVV